MSDFDSVFRELATDAKAARDFSSTSSVDDHLAQRRIWRQRRRANRISGFFV